MGSATQSCNDHPHHTFPYLPPGCRLELEVGEIAHDEGVYNVRLGGGAQMKLQASGGGLRGWEKGKGTRYVI